MIKIYSPMATGNGAIIVHQKLESKIRGYKVIPYNPYLTLMPPLLGRTLKRKSSLVHTTPDYAWFLRKKNTPLILTFHNYMLDEEMLAYSSFLQKIHYKTDLRYFTRKALQYSHCLTAVSHFTAQIAQKDLNVKKNIKVIPNGINDTVFFPITNKKLTKTFKVLFSGNMSLRKGAHWLPQIIDILPDHIKIYCATGLRTKIPKNMQHPRIHYLEQVAYKNMPELYQSMDALLMPTVREGLSLAVLEAMACGLPVVSSNCSSLPEQIIEGRGGYLCETGNINEYANAISALAQDRIKSKEMGSFNRQRIEEKFRLDKMINAYQQVFEEVLDKI